MDCWFSKYLVLRRELLTPEDFTFLGSETAQMPTAMMHSPACTGLRAQPSGNQNSWWVSQGCDQENLTFVHSLYQLFFYPCVFCLFVFLKNSSSPLFFFSCISVSCFWLELAMELLNNRSWSNCIADSILRACSHQISLQHSRFQYPKISDTYLNQTSWGWTIPNAKTARAGLTHIWTRFHQSTGDSMPTMLKAISTYIISTPSDLVNYPVNCLGIHIYT